MTGVLFDVRRATWYPEVGLARYARSLLAALLRAKPTDLRLIPIDLSGSPHWTAEPTYRVGRRHDLISRAAQEQLLIACRSRRADLIHLPWYEGPLLPGCPLVATVHDLDTIAFPERYPWRFRAYYNTLLRCYVRQARRIVVDSMATHAELEARWPGRPYVHIYPGVDPVFSPTPGEEHAAAEPFLLYTGGWGKRKRVRELVGAFQRLASGRADLGLVMTGDPPPEDAHVVAASPAARRITLTGRVSDERLAALYRGAALVIYPSALEGFGFPVVEAFASGTPIVAIRAASVPEVAGDAALLVDRGEPAELADAIAAVLDDGVLARTLAERGLVRAAEFSWSRTADRMLGLYREVLAEIDAG
jgi:glycosyltransferase involved in cell wall biosynthesis